MVAPDPLSSRPTVPRGAATRTLTALATLALLVLASSALSGQATPERGDEMVPAGPDDSATTVAAESSPAALDPALEEQVREIASSLRCPVCLGLSVEDSPTQLARDMKDFIRKRLREGAEPEEIRQHFVDLYGEWVLMTPEPEGLNLALWIVPVLAVLGGLVLVGTLVRRWKETPGE